MGWAGHENEPGRDPGCGPGEDRKAALLCIYLQPWQQSGSAGRSLDAVPHFAVCRKKSLEKIPLFGWAARRARVIFIDRSDGPKAIARINKAIQELKDGISACFFAEGTRNLGGKLNPFKKGGVVLALKAKLPIVPITILDSYKLFPKKALRIKPGVLNIIVGEPIETSSYNEQDKDVVLEKVRSTIYQNLQHYDVIDYGQG